MKDQSFLQSKWRPFEVIHVYVPDLERFVDCIVVGIDFEDRIFNVRPLIKRGGQPKLKVRHINKCG